MAQILFLELLYFSWFLATTNLVYREEHGESTLSHGLPGHTVVTLVYMNIVILASTSVMQAFGQHESQAWPL